ncbi:MULTISPECIES: hypothetical protein [unclassified Streptomyces]|uniref:hypothetical protein n=1 Tax=unclassified Streptomyces TaxID=2593676 RepID=UPI0010EDC77C|nr:hypothetical protein [Streptomyces sp. L-9-10]RYJ23002.1 hypothetical protein CU044_5634 [Streptomyces sp. L-9-10]
MFAYELQKINEAELIRRAEEQRLVREVRAARRQARRAAREAREGRVNTWHDRFTRAA